MPFTSCSAGAFFSFPIWQFSRSCIFPHNFHYFFLHSCTATANEIASNSFSILHSNAKTFFVVFLVFAFLLNLLFFFATLWHVLFIFYDFAFILLDICKKLRMFHFKYLSNSQGMQLFHLIFIIFTIFQGCKLKLFCLLALHCFAFRLSHVLLVCKCASNFNKKLQFSIANWHFQNKQQKNTQQQVNKLSRAPPATSTNTSCFLFAARALKLSAYFSSFSLFNSFLQFYLRSLAFYFSKLICSQQAMIMKWVEQSFI